MSYSPNATQYSYIKPPATGAMYQSMQNSRTSAPPPTIHSLLRKQSSNTLQSNSFPDSSASDKTQELAGKLFASQQNYARLQEKYDADTQLLTEKVAKLEQENNDLKQKTDLLNQANKIDALTNSYNSLFQTVGALVQNNNYLMGHFCTNPIFHGDPQKIATAMETLKLFP